MAAEPAFQQLRDGGEEDFDALCPCTCCCSCCRLLRDALADDRGRKLVLATGFGLLVTVVLFPEPLLEFLAQVFQVSAYILRPLLLVEELVPKPLLVISVFIAVTATICYLCAKNLQLAVAVTAGVASLGVNCRSLFCLVFYPWISAHEAGQFHIPGSWASERLRVYQGVLFSCFWVV
ncbi:unnamed protein product [Polarella glacialis]|uniref:Uncharacterized protein n=1 Tax=Polarella glacialis TaxID=89957 RepID=A0A813KA21_POLGL|nr:unnamed protein product [Polarella glacialis]